MAKSTPWRPQPPSIEDPTPSDAELTYLGEEHESSGMETVDVPEEERKSGQPDWARRARDAFRFSTSYVDSNYRKQWDDSIRAFNNQHAGDSKYNSELFRKRSNLFRPKTRAIIRKNEAAAAAAFFSNSDLIDVTAVNQSDKAEIVSAEVTKQLIQYRLGKSIPWFQVCVGAIQDGHVQGAVAAHIYWKFYEKHDNDGVRTQLEDRPVVDLIPIENLRIDPSADWMDPIGSSPYLIHIIPMYWCDVKEKMTAVNPKGQTWKPYPAQVVFQRTNDSTDDSTRQARIQVQQDPSQQKRDVSDYDIVWVHRHIHRFEGEDWEFYTVSSEKMLTDPEPLQKTVWHGQRPYVLGKVMLETHKPLSTPVPILIKPLQDEANDLQNQRLDNVKLVLNKRWFAKRGKNVDLASLVRNVPGGITLLDDPETDVKEITWPDVTQSAYLEQDRVDGDFSDLVGNFNPMQVQAQRTGRESTNTMRMLQGPTNLLTEYMLKTFTETFVQPVLRLVMLLEQHYESDVTLIALAGKKAQVMKRFGMSDVTDAILDSQMNITVNVGMGATDPVQKLQRFVYAAQSFAQLMRFLPPFMDAKELWKEYAGLSGYQDGERFVVDGANPEVMKLQQTIQQLQTQLLKGPAAKAQATQEQNQSREKIARQNNVTKLLIARKQSDSAKEEKVLEHKLGLAAGEVEHQHGMETEGYKANLGFEADSRKADQQARLGGNGAGGGKDRLGITISSKRLAQAGDQQVTKLVQSQQDLAKSILQGQEDLARSIAELARSIAQEHGESLKPRKRTGRAKLPSGGMMEFEMTDS